MTVRPRPSMTRVAGPRRRRISSFPPVVVTFPSEIAIASTNEGTPFVAILALCKMISADTRISFLFFVFHRLVKKGGSIASAPCSLLVSYDGSGNGVFGELRGWSAVHHRVHVLDSDPIRSVMVLHNVHHGVVSFLVGPVALPLQHGGKRRHGFRSRLDHSLHRVVMSELAHVTAAIFHHVDFVAVVDRLYRGKRHASLRPQAGKHDLFASAFLDRGDKVLVVPRVHGRTLDGFLPREYRSQLRPHIPAEGLRLDRGQNHRYIEHSGGFSECYCVVDDSLAVEIA